MSDININVNDEVRNKELCNYNTEITEEMHVFFNKGGMMFHRQAQ